MFVESFFIAQIGLFFYIELLGKLRVGYQKIRECGPKSHIAKKAGTFTGGGVVLISILLIMFRDLKIAQLFGGFALIGAVDDVLKIIYGIRRKVLNMKLAYLISTACFVLGLPWIACIALGLATKDRGLNVKNKFILQVAVALVYVLSFNYSLFWVCFYSLAIIGVANAVNLSDGLDGLISVPLMLAFGFYVYKFSGMIQSDLALNAIAVLAAFLVFNFHPAKIFMGDVGSLAFGALLAGLAIETNTIFALIPIGFIFAVNAGSVILQVGWYKMTRKRLFLMAPIHHHFEYKGYSEQTIVFFIWGMQTVLVLIALMFY